MAGMNDAELTQALRHIGVDKSTVRALPLLPLVQVAWADGRVQPAERGLILEVAQRYGLGKAELKLLDRWLAKQPEEADFLLARRVLLVLWSRDRERGQAPESLDGVIRMCMCVARVAGGLFGLAFTMDRREVELIGEISQSLQLGPQLTAAAKAAIASEPRPGRNIADDETAIFPRKRPEPPSPMSLVETPITSKRLARPATPVDPSDADADVEEKERAQSEADLTTARHPTLDPSADDTTKRPSLLFPDETTGRHRPLQGSRHGPAGETLLPPDEDDDEFDSSTVPLASLKRMLEEEEETEVDIPMLPHDYHFDFD